MTTSGSVCATAGFLILLPVILHGESFAQSPPGAREWADSSGQFKVTAEFVRIDPAGVVLRRLDGREITVSLNRLSKADQDFLAPQGNPFEAVGSGAADSLKPGEARAPVGKIDEVSSYLLVSAKSAEGQGRVYSGIVFAADEKYAYVAVQPPMQRHYGDYNLLNTISDYQALVGSGDELKRVPLHKVVFSTRRHKLVLAGPKALLPSPKPPQDFTAINENDVLHFEAHEVREQNEWIYFRHVAESRVRRIFTSPDGRRTGFAATVTASIPAREGVVATADGTVFAVRHDGTQSAVADGTKLTTFVSVPLEDFVDLLKSDVMSIQTTWTVKPQVVDLRLQVQLCELSPPLRELRLLCCVRSPKQAFREQPTLQVIDGIWADKTEDGFDLPLTRISTADASFGKVLDPSQWTRTQTWKSEKTLPPETGSWSAIGQVVYSDPTGKYVPVGMPMRFSFDISSDELEKARAEQKPALLAHPRGGEFVTTAETRVQTAPRVELKLNRPQPQQTGYRCLADLNRGPHCSTAELILSPATYMGRQRNHAAVSDDGKTLFLIDHMNVLRRINTSTWTEEVLLGMPADCEEMALSVSGLLLLLPKEGVIWILDPATLAVKYELEMPPFCEFVTASPKSSLAFASGGRNLTVIDVASGEKIHEISKERFKTLFGEGGFGAPGIHATRDGKYLFLRTGELHRMRIEGQDLIREQQSHVPLFVTFTGVGMSDDGRQIIVPLRKSGPKTMNGMDLAVPATEMLPVECDRVVIDPVSGSLYASREDKFLSFGRQGEIQFEHGLRNASRKLEAVIPIPGGNRFVLVDSQRAWVADLTHERLANALMP